MLGLRKLRVVDGDAGLAPVEAGAERALAWCSDGFAILLGGAWAWALKCCAVV